MEEAEGLSAEQLAHDGTQAEGLPRVPRPAQRRDDRAGRGAERTEVHDRRSGEHGNGRSLLRSSQRGECSRGRRTGHGEGRGACELPVEPVVHRRRTCRAGAGARRGKQPRERERCAFRSAEEAFLGGRHRRDRVGAGAARMAQSLVHDVRDRDRGSGARLRAQASCPVGLDAGRARKKMSGRRCMQFGHCLICCGAALMSATTLAQTYPTKPVRYVIPMSPGSGADVIGRIVAIGLAPALGQQVVVDNRTGAAGNIGAELVAKAPPDGYTVFQGSMTHTTNVSLYTNLTYDFVRDFAPVTLLATSPASLVVHPSLPVNTVADLVAFAKARPGQLNYASTGLGTATFLAAEMFKERAGIDL